MATQHQNSTQLDLSNVPSAKNMRFVLVVSEWNTQITENLFLGAKKVLLDKGAEKIDRVDVPGSFELIYGARCQFDKDYDAIIAIGSVIRGETKHFDYVCQSVSHGVKDLNLLGKTPVIFCVLTDDNVQQAIDRSGGALGNKGAEAAVAAIRMAAL
ncbi:MAG: 6,7-dimethyl-8-ribityllumazine synthase [Flavobacteriaceae bacterium]|nr:6,7-dimethyl-8-ribityllumazine synthase [Flavobacteriaceae bacterium]